MKKTLFALMALTLVCAITLSSCTKTNEDDTISEKTKLLTQTKGWILTAATSDPAFETSGGESIIDLYANNVINPWEKDDVFFYTLNGTVNNLSVDPGKILPPEGEDGYTKKGVISKWRFVNDEKEIAQDPPFWYDPEDDSSEPSVLIALTETTLQYKFKFDYEYSGEKKVYWWTYTFKVK